MGIRKGFASFCAILFRLSIIAMSVFLLSGCQFSLEQLKAELFADKTQWYVSTTGNDSNPCHTAVNPCRNIATALSRAAAGDTIHVADGNYYEMLNITKNVSLLGTSMENTVIDANIKGGSVITLNQTPVVGNGISLNLSDMTLTGGAAGRGGGVYISGGYYIALTNVKIDQNAAFHSGGGMYINTAQRTVLKNVQVTNNSVSTTGEGEDDGDGGGIYFSPGVGLGQVGLEFELDISDSIISNNSSTYSGGGIYNEATLNVTNSTIAFNTTKIYGGGVDDTYIASIASSSILGNKAHNGGGLLVESFNESGVLTVAESTIDGNQAEGSGGGIGVMAGALSVISSTISNNSSPIGGGVMTSSPMYSINSTYSGNSSPNGAGIWSIGYAGSLEGENLTIANNNGIGVGVDRATFTLTNVLVANNQGGNCHFPYPENLTIMTSMSNDDTCTGFQQADFSLSDLADNGGLTKTQALPPGSPARDAGTNLQGLFTDQRQYPRPVDSDGDGTAKMDIGAFEAEYTVFPAKTLIPASISTFTPTFTPTLNLEKANPEFTPNINAYCRSGPDRSFPGLEVAMSGQAYLVDGRNLASNWFRIMFTPNEGCWVPMEAGTLSVDPARLRVLADVPTLTPTGITVKVDCSTFTDKRSCEGQSSCTWIDSAVNPSHCGNK